MIKKVLLILFLLIVTVSLAGCQQSNNQEEVYYGTAEMEQISFCAETAGVIKEIKVSEGSQLKTNDTIAVINTAEVDIKSQQADVAVQQAENEQQRVEDLPSVKDTAEKAAALGVEQAQLNAQLAELQKSKGEVKALVSGMVDTVNYSVGEYVIPGSAVVTVSNPQNLWVKIYVPERVLPQLKLNQEVTVKSDAIEKEFKGSISNISSKAEYTPMNIVTKKDREKLVYEIKVQLKNSTEEIKAGMLLDVYLK